ncbi:MAG: adenylyl-sulfate kinase [Thermodesulfovibrionales bacterium]
MANCVIWITGLPGSGKSTIAEGLKDIVKDIVILRVDEIRKFITPKPTYSEDEREIVYRALVFTALKLFQKGHTVIIDATANMRRWRDLARQCIDRFLEVYVRCPLEVCISRERSRADTFGAPVHIYEKAKEGWPVPGVNVPYEEPINPDLIIDTHLTSPDVAIGLITDRLMTFQTLK